MLLVIVTCNTLTNYDLVNKALVCLAIETALIKIGKPVYDKVLYDLLEKFHCYLTDCYEHPEYLNEVLKGLYGNSHEAIVQSIKKQLEEFSYKKSVEKFLQVISQ